ncbi:HAD family hydrolase [Mycobacterium sp. 236(2023)]|uniref:HAD family hydrolase n=1 Tax=Mycobacterium sp. 236(2023) TaxID=3038163 RepID=UPI0024150A44|nr:HAD family hydrolase [Mycobacterium sp. 236(2023)]MDG4663984.1 haloacid dehalogenase [Mycobacterium sp. 236(2023)]
MQPTQQKAWRAGRFWWDWPSPAQPQPLTKLSAVIVDLDALADVESAGHRRAFNAAFAALGLDIAWSEPRYRQLQALADERRRVAAELRKRGVSSECDVLAELLVDEICATKAMILDETILDADIAARPGMVDLLTEAYGAGVGVGIVSSGSHGWVEPLVRQLIGEGIAGAVVTTDDVPRKELYAAALAELGAPVNDSLAFAGSQASQRIATATGLATVLVEGDSAGGGAPLRVADCQRAHDAWWETHPRPTAA